MITLRLVGIVVGLLAFALAWFARFRRRRLRNADWILASLIAVGLVWVAIFPDTVNRALQSLSFEKGGNKRLIGLLIVSNLVLYALAFAALLRSNRLERVLDDLVRELAKQEFHRTHSPDDAPVYVVIPAYNEAENIGAVLESIPKEVAGLRTRAVVVVDGATDATTAVVRDLDRAAVSYSINRGGGSALKAGYQLALEGGAEIVVTLDADGQHMPEEIPVLLQPILDGRADLVNGSRVLGHFEKESELRAAGVVFFNWLVSALTMTRITDCSNAFRAIRTDVLRQLDLRQTQFHTSELLIDALKKGFRVVEVPITIRRRQGGKSKKGPSLTYALGFTRAIIGTWLR